MSTSTIIQKNEPVKFLNWLYHRLKNKYNEEEIVLARIADIIHNYNFIQSKFDIDFAEKLCKKHFVEYELSSDDDSCYGFNDNLKLRLVNLVIDTIKQVGAVCNEEQNNSVKESRDIDFDIDII
jgi:hypothetical protein